MFGFLLWLIMGAFVGWIASLIMKTDASMGTFLNIVVGVVGAAVGGFLFRLLGFDGGNINSDGLSLSSFIVSLVGAVVVIFLVQMVRKAAR